LVVKATPKPKTGKPKSSIGETLKLDVRLRERYLRDGLLSRTELERELKALPDVADKAEVGGGDDPARSRSRTAGKARK